MIDLFRRSLWELGLITDPTQDWQIRLWFNHGLGHWVGMDTHDCGSYRLPDGASRPLVPGMVLTIEPGLYIDLEKLDHLPAFVNYFHGRATVKEQEAFRAAVMPNVRRYHGIGVRIEDDVLVTQHGHEVLSQAAPNEVTDVEKFLLGR